MCSRPVAVSRLVVTVGLALASGLSGCSSAPAKPLPDMVALPRGCGMPGEPGNSLGVGKYCTANGSECSGNSFAIFCTVTFVPGSMPYCTSACQKDADCGENAYCSGSGMGSKGCVPALCGGKPANLDGGSPDSGVDGAAKDATLPPD